MHSEKYIPANGGRVSSCISIEDAKIFARNFSGKESMYNRSGDRNFCVILTDRDVVQNLKNDGWPVKQFRPRDEDETDPDYYLQISVKFGDYPPKIIQRTSRNQVELDEDCVCNLDSADIANIDLIIRPYNWSLTSGKNGIKAYLKTGYFTIEEDEFAEKYYQD